MIVGRGCGVASAGAWNQTLVRVIVLSGGTLAVDIDRSTHPQTHLARGGGSIPIRSGTSNGSWSAQGRLGTVNACEDPCRLPCVASVSTGESIWRGLLRAAEMIFIPRCDTGFNGCAEPLATALLASCARAGAIATS